MKSRHEDGQVSNTSASCRAAAVDMWWQETVSALNQTQTLMLVLTWTTSVTEIYLKCNFKISCVHFILQERWIPANDR